MGYSVPFADSQSVWLNGHGVGIPLREDLHSMYDLLDMRAIGHGLLDINKLVLKLLHDFLTDGVDKAVECNMTDYNGGNFMVRFQLTRFASRLFR